MIQLEPVTKCHILKGLKMKVTEEKIGNYKYDVHHSTCEDESQTIATCRICGDHTRKYVIEEGIVCVSCIKNYELIVT